MPSNSSDGYDYVREHYGVEVNIGDLVTIDGEQALVSRGRNDQYVWVRFEGRAPDVPCHPTWRFVNLKGTRVDA